MAGILEADLVPSRVERLLNLGGLIATHIGACFAVVVHFRMRDVIIAVALYWIRMFAVTAGYHRYFAHRSFKTSRVFQFILAFIGTSCTQKGPLWWAAIHRRHHRDSDGPADVHSPVQRGFYNSHIGWIVECKHDSYDAAEVKDFQQYPELRFISRFHMISVFMLIAAAFAFGGVAGVVWWFCVSTVALWHGCFTINSLSHVWGHRRFATDDDSRNNWLLALITMGEGWHNNHHRFMQSARQGFYWWQIDVSYYLLRALAAVGVVWDLRAPSERVLAEGRNSSHLTMNRASGGIGA
jgi:stearoyl-CoA desaturase (Delta-9 desaturase)